MGSGGSAGNVVAQLGDVMAQKRMWWLSRRCCGSVRGCGGSFGDVVAQSAKHQNYTRLQRSSSRFDAFDPGIPHSLLRGDRNND
jgi:hypothetical protein